MSVFRPALWLVSVLSFMYSVVAFVGRLEQDAYVAAIVAVFAGSGLVLIAELEDEHNRRIAQTRMDVWARRDREGFGA